MMIANSKTLKSAPALAECFALLLLSAMQAHASTTTFYNTQAGFDSAASGMTSFNYTAAPGLTPGIYLQPSPVSRSTASSNLAPGSIPAGITISNLNGALTPGLIFFTSGQVPGAGAALGTNYFGDTLVLSFGSGVHAVGQDVFAAVAAEQALAGTFSEEAFDGTTLLGSTIFSDAAGQVAFEGVTSTVPITSVQLLYLTDDASTFANGISFGRASGGTGTGGGDGGEGGEGGEGGHGGTSPVPEPSTWILLSMGLSLVGFQRGVFFAKRTRY